MRNLDSIAPKKMQLHLPKIGFFAFLLTMSLHSKAQSIASGTTTPVYGMGYIGGQMQNPTDSYNVICKRADAFFASIPEGTIILGLEGLKETYGRWSQYWEGNSCYYGSPAGGDIIGAKAVLTTAATTIPYCATSVAGAQPWIPEGPMSSPLCNIGVIHAVAYDPNYVNTIYAGSNTGGLFKTTDHGAHWTNITNNNIVGIGILPSTGIGSIAVDPNNSNNIFAGTTTPAFGNGFGMGILKSNNGGASWTIANIIGSPAGGNGVRKIIISNSGSFILAAVGTDIFKSTDGGATFNKMTMIPILNGNYTYPACNATPPNTFQEQVANNIIDIEQSLSNPAIFYASTETYGRWNGSNGPSKLLISTDNAQTWNLLSLPISNGGDAISVDVTPAEPGAVFIYYGTGVDACSGTSVFAKSTDNGATWTIIDQPSNPGYGHWYPIFEVSNTNNTDYFIGGTQTYKFTYSTISNSYISNVVTMYYPSLGIGNQHGDIRAMAFRTNGSNTEIIVGCDGGVIESLTGGDYGTWTCINGTGLNNSQFYGISTFRKTDNIVAAPQDSWLKIRNAGVWNPSPGSSTTNGGIDGEAYWVEADYANDNIVYASGNQAGYLISNDGGANYSAMPSCPGGWRLGGKFYIDPTNHNYLWNASAQDGNLYRFDNSSNTWSTIHSPVALATYIDGNGNTQTYNMYPVNAVAVAPSNSNVIFESHLNPTYNYYHSQKFYKSNNGGSTWADITANIGDVCDNSFITHITIDPLNEKRIFVSVGGYWADGSDPLKGQKRVMYSGDGGLTWSDMSIGLTPFQVNYLAYQNGSSDVIYAATDAGVYRWNKATQIWECFNLGLPNTQVRKVEINYCQNKVYAAVYGRGVYSCELPTIPDFHISTALVNSINGTNVLTIPANYNQEFNNRIIADAGVQVNINGTMNFGTNGAYVVNTKNRTVLTGTMSTNCPQLWLGILVGGDISHDQSLSGAFATYQGKLDINGGTISNAQNGIIEGIYDVNGLDWGSLGGLIVCNQAKFLNNKRDVAFLYYPFPNKSRFTRCTFEVNSTLLGGGVPEGRVSLWGVQGVNFAGNDFKYTAGSAYPQGSHGYGIFSIDAKYTVTNACLNAICTASKRGTVSNFDIGISVSNSNPLQTVSIYNNDFTGNFTDAARLSGVNYAVFVGNNVNVGAAGSSNASGVYMDNSKFYSIQNNNITTSFVGSNVGVYTYQSGTGAHLVNRNTINNLLVGVIPMNDNSGDANFNDGLKIKCNDFMTNTANKFDIALLGNGLPSQNPSVAYFQGYYTSGHPEGLVGNKYKATCGGENKWYVNTGITIKGALHQNHSDAFVQITPQPSCSNVIIVPNTVPIGLLPSHCPDNYSISKNISQIKNNVMVAKVAAAQATGQYTATIDGGNTALLLAAITNTTISNGNLKNLMEQYSPYLSDEVLTAYFNKVSVPNGHLKDIHDKNKPVQPTVWQVLVNRNLPNGIMKDLTEQQATKVIPARTLLQGNMANAIYDRELAYAEEIRYYLNDSLPNSQDSAIAIVKTAGFADSDCQYIAGQVAKPNTTLTASQIDAMHGGSAYVDDFCNFQKIVLQLNQTLQKVYTMKTDGSIKGQVELVASGNKDGYRQAQALLKQVFNTDFPVLRLVPNGSAQRLSKTEDETTHIVLPDGMLNLYPNPATNLVNVLLKTTVDDTQNYQVEIKNLLGQIVISKTIVANKVTELSIEELTSALYIVSIKQGDTLIKETKLAILK